MRARDYTIAGAAAVVLTAGSVAAIAATGTSMHVSGVGMHRVVSTCTLPSSLPGQQVTVMLADMPGHRPMMNRYGGMMGGYGGMMLRAFPRTVSAGTVSLVAVNHGSRTHELVVLPLAPTAAAGTRVVDSDDTVSERGSLGEASYNCGRGAGHGIRSGGAGWVTLTLRPGRYELVCNLPGHYAAGMYAELDVR